MARSIEAFATYHRKKESLTEYLQVSAAGLALLRRNVEVSNGPALLGALVDACGIAHWSTGKRFANAVSKVDTGILALADQGVIQHVAAFDIFTRSLVQDLAMFSSRARTANPELDHDHSLLQLSSGGRWVSHHCCHDLAGRLGTLSQRIATLTSWTGWIPSAKLAPILPLFDLARSVRNKIAHDGGIVGADLETLSTGNDVQAALAAFRASYTRANLPQLPRFKRGQPLNLNVVHAIFFGAILYEIAREINEYASGLIDDAEFIDMAFYYSCIVDEHPFRKARYRFAENRVNHFVSERYLRQRISPDSSTVITRLTAQTVTSGTVETTYWAIARGAHSQLQS